MTNVDDAHEFCWRCKLRLSGRTDQAAYATDCGKTQADQPIKEKNFDDEASDIVCPLCLGLLTYRVTSAKDDEEECSRGKLEASVYAILERYEIRPGDGFSLDVSLPAATAIRWRALQARGFNPADKAVVDLKDAMRWTYIPLLARALGAGYDPNAGLRLTLTGSDETGEAAWLSGRIRQQVDQTKRKKVYGKRRRAKSDIVPGEKMVASTKVIEELAALDDATFLEQCPETARDLICPPSAAFLMIKATRAPYFLGGRYIKLQRGIPQSPWFIDGVRRGDSSVEERLATVLLPALRCQGATFSSAGREDIDVRMLGTGRPWALEISDSCAAPPDAEACAHLQRTLNMQQPGKVQIMGLRLLTRPEVTLMRDEDGEKEKSYVAICWSAKPLTGEQVSKLRHFKNLTIQQQTPIRVVHRRANLVRPRTIIEMEARPIEGTTQCFLLGLRTQAGTYVKEFVHGDLGRTKPCLGDLLGCQTTIVHLDVVNIHMDF